MSKEDFLKLKGERSQLRRVFTRCCSRIDELLTNDVFDSNELTLEFKKLEDKAGRLFSIDDKVNSLIFSFVSDEDELKEEYDKVENYRDKLLAYRFKRDETFKVDVPLVGGLKDADDVSFASVNSQHKHSYKLPKLELKKFDGQIKNWLGFWSQHKLIYEDQNLEEVDKFHFLYQSTVEHSPARELLDSFPATAANYRKAIEQLKRRFGREDLLVELYVRELLTLVLMQNSKKQITLQSLYDKLEAQLNALESLGVTSDKYACLLFPLVESALPETTLLVWERHRVSLDYVGEEKESSQKLVSLLKFLQNEVIGEERLAMARLRLTPKIEEKHNVKRPFVTVPNKIPSAAGLVNTKAGGSEKESCIFCEGFHPSDSCFKARSLNVEERNKVIREKGCCFLCLKKNHTKRHCRAFLNCIICSKKHLPLLCPERNKKEEKADPVEANLYNTTYGGVLMQTLVVKLRGDKEVMARVLIDTGSHRSYITHKLAKQMKYPVLREEKLTHALFGGSTSDVKIHQCYKIRLASTVNNYCCNFEALSTSVICNAVPAASQGAWIQELFERGIKLTDLQEGPIDILIGADIAGKLLTGSKQTLDSGLVAIETLLGWTLMGKVDKLANNYMSNISLLCSEFSPSDGQIKAEEEEIESTQQKPRDQEEEDQPRQEVMENQEGAESEQLKKQKTAPTQQEVEMDEEPAVQQEKGNDKSKENVEVRKENVPPIMPLMEIEIKKEPPLDPGYRENRDSVKKEKYGYETHVKEEPWSIFVHNRVREILSLTCKDQWYHIPGTVNPADLLSWGCYPRALIATQWWEGPSWLCLPKSQWPSSQLEESENAIKSEKRKTTIAAVSTQPNCFCSGILARRFSSYPRIIRLVAWMLRFLINKFSKRRKYAGELTVKELSRAEKLIIKVIQCEAFDGIKDSTLRRLKPNCDAAGLLRLRTKIWARKDTEEFRAPYILPSNHIIVDRMIKDTHVKNGHICGKDKKIRVAKLKTKDGILVRPVQRIFPLEVHLTHDPQSTVERNNSLDSISDNGCTEPYPNLKDTTNNSEAVILDEPEEQEVMTRSGRLCKMPSRFID